jgi:hypothetical protein
MSDSPVGLESAIQKDRSEEFVDRDWAAEPTLLEVLILAGVCYLVYACLIALLDNYSVLIRTFGDNQAYVGIATAIRHWDLASVRVWHFWGLPYAIVAFAFITHTSFWTALLVISIVSSFLAVAMADRLWGGWVAGFFAVASRDWMERSMLGGAEPLFLVLVLASFLAARRQRWLMAALLASLSTLVRPMGIFALASIGIVLLIRKEFKILGAAILIGLVIGGLYVLPLRAYLGSSLANIQGYGRADGSAGKPLTYPFMAFVHISSVGPITRLEDVNAGRTTGLNLARTALWIGIVVLGVVAMFLKRQFRNFARNHVVEVLFCALYVALLFTYNSPWARTAFPRYAIPIIPFVVLAFVPWIPKDRRLLWAFGLGSAMISAASTVGIMHSWEILRRAL